MYLRRGIKSRAWMVDIRQMSSASGNEMCLALPGLYSFTGCDTVSTLTNQGKVKALKILQQHQTYQQAFIPLGAS